jgi:choline dehydrogenase-like flavoprotein
VNAPQILMLSGIGDADELARHGIAAVHHLPGVGCNLQDHMDCCLAFECLKPVTLYRHLRADRLLWSIPEGMAFGRGIATTFPYEAGAFMSFRPGLRAPDIQAHFMPAAERTANLDSPRLFGRAATAANHGFTIRAGPVNQESRGWIGLRSATPDEAPLIEANCLGTCKMGPTPEALVDAQLRVHGIERLRVADASIMPIICSGNTNALTIMIAETVATLLRIEKAGSAHTATVARRTPDHDRRSSHLHLQARHAGQVAQEIRDRGCADPETPSRHLHGPLLHRDRQPASGGLPVGL